jgi:hypothetical protein
MATKQEHTGTPYNLGLEELALCLGLINHQDLGRSLILDIYPSLSSTQIDERLTSASHSLLAHGLCGIGKNGEIVLEKNLEKVIHALAKFDKLVQINITNLQTQASARIHIVRNTSFTSHMVSIGVVHTLEHGSYRNLYGYIYQLFMGFDKALNTRKQDRFEHPITLGVLGSLLESENKNIAAKDILISNGWSSEWAVNLANDLLHQEVRSTLLVVDANFYKDETAVGDLNLLAQEMMQPV